FMKNTAALTITVAAWWMPCESALSVDQPVAQASALSSGDHTRTITVGGLKRSYHVHVPKSYDGSRRFPVVLVFHGGGSSAKQWIPFCGLNETADKAD